MKIFKLIIFLLFFTNISNAQWVQFGLGSTLVNSLSASGNFIYAGSSNKVYILYGASWSQIFQTALSGFVSAVAANVNYVYAGTDTPFIFGIYVSSDTGITWTHPFSGHNVQSVAVNGNYVFDETGVRYIDLQITA